PAAVAAAKKAFVMNAIGDATMALAFFVLILHSHSLSYATSFATAGHLSSTTVSLVALGLLGGAAAKSAQIPLHTWLPDAMEGPTPVSALIHAATMVTAGVYLIARTSPIFEQARTVELVAAGMGALTLLVASLALVGIFPFAGFFSKDSIIAAALHVGWYGWIFWAVALAGTFLTGLYTFRLYFIVFPGEPSAYVQEHFASHHAGGEDDASRPHGEEPHHGEGPRTMLVPVAVLTVLSAIGGWLQF